MFELELLLPVLIVFSCLICAASCKFIKLARLGSTRARSWVLLAALATAFSVFWAPFAFVGPAPGDAGESARNHVGPVPPHMQSHDWIASAQTNSSPGAATLAGSEIIVFVSPMPADVSPSSLSVIQPQNRANGTVLQEGFGLGGRAARSEVLPDRPYVDFTGMGSATAGADPTAASGSTGDIAVDGGLGVLAFWTFSMALAAFAAAYLAFQLSLGKRRLLARLGARPCRDPELAAMVGKAAREMGLKSPRVFVCAGGPNAFVFGYPACLVISSSLLGRLTKSELRLCICHELAHIKNGDLVVKPLLQSIRILLFYNPAVHLLVRRMLKERELEADRLFIRTKKDKLDFMMALAKVHDLGRRMAPAQDVGGGFASALDAHGAGGHLAERYDNLFTARHGRPLVAAFVCALILGANLAILAVPAAIHTRTDLSADPRLDAGSSGPFYPQLRGLPRRSQAFPHTFEAVNITLQLVPVRPLEFAPPQVTSSIPLSPGPQAQATNLSELVSDPARYAGSLVRLENVTVVGGDFPQINITDGTGTAVVLLAGPFHPGRGRGTPNTRPL